MKWRAAGSGFLGPRGMTAARGPHSTCRMGWVPAGEESCDGRCGDKIESPRSRIVLRSDQPLSRTQMGAPVAKTHGMRPGVPGRSDRRGSGRGYQDADFLDQAAVKSRTPPHEDWPSKQLRNVRRGCRRRTDNEPADTLAMKALPLPRQPLPLIVVVRVDTSDLARPTSSTSP